MEFLTTSRAKTDPLPGSYSFRILGIDPGLASSGFGVIERRSGRLFHISHGCITTGSGIELSVRLETIFDRISAILEEYKPDAVAMESLFFSKNVTSALLVSEAKGVIRLSCRKAGLTLREYSPVMIKQAVSGDGSADKRQVQGFVKMILGLESLPQPDHAADALACAIARAHDALMDKPAISSI